MSTVPHLTTAQSGPLLHLESIFLEKQSQIENWFRQQWAKTPAPFYASVDLRNSGFKVAPVDTNLFPAGFNNLNPQFYALCVQAVQSVLERICPGASKVLVIPENHTRNQFYLENLATLTQIISMAGYEVKIGSLVLEEAMTIGLDSGKSLRLEPIQRSGQRLHVGDFDPCSILLNNDMSGGRPEILEGIEQHLLPPLGLGWSNRLKSQHFAVYREVAQEFAAFTGLDRWLVDPLFSNCGEVDFKDVDEDSCLSKKVSALLNEIQDKYDEYDIDREPFVIVKADAGTYGMGIMTAKSAEDVQTLNRKQRNRMTSLKEGRSTEHVIIQEGVYTDEEWAGSTAEPVIYMIDHFVVGGFYRVHSAKGKNENLNSPGMHFEPLAFAESCNTPDCAQAPDAEPNRFYAYGVVARLALLAAAREREMVLAEGALA